MPNAHVICFNCIHNERHQAKREGRAMVGECKCLRSGMDVLEHQSSGKCPEGFFNGQPMPVRRVVEGAVKAAAAIVGVDAASPEVIAARTETCRTCEHSRFINGTLRKCNVCGCSIRLKVQMKSEACPQGKWGAA